MKTNIALDQWTTHSHLKHWIQEFVSLCKPQDVWLCDGSQKEYESLCKKMTNTGTLFALDEKVRPNSFLARTTPDDVARVEDRTFICAKTEKEAGPTNHWQDPQIMRKRLLELFQGCMQGRTLYVIPFCMGPLNSSLSHLGIQITDSPYVVCSMRIMTRMGKPILEQLGAEGFFVPCVHSVGMPLKPGVKDVPWPTNAQDKAIVHFPENREIWSYGSGYGGNALLGKKCFALRIASCMARDEGWLAEHMLIMGVTNPQGEKKYFAAAFPSACGKTNLAMMTPTLPGWKVEMIGDDIAWMKFGKDGRLYAINPEAGLFGVAPGTSFDSNPNAMQAITKNTIFTNVGLTPQKDVWWEGMTKKPPDNLTNWLGHAWKPGSTERAAHPNARFTCPVSQCPAVDSAWNDPQGVPIEAIIFGGRRSSVVPLVTESFSWQHGVFFGASLSSEMTAAAAGVIGKLRHDPFAMLPFCGYNMGEYFGHWLSLATAKHKLPRIFHVNWFRKNAQGEWLWPGFGENSRVLKWIFERIQGNVQGQKSAIGYHPKIADFDTKGLSISKSNLEELFQVNKDEWLQEVEELGEYFQIFGTSFPQPLQQELNDLNARLADGK